MKKNEKKWKKMKKNKKKWKKMKKKILFYFEKNNFFFLFKLEMDLKK
jgi:hypothetical protein